MNNVNEYDMRTNYLNKCGYLSVLAFFAVNAVAGAQETKESVILYNSVPVRAEITKDAEIKRIIKEEPDYLKGFSLKIQDYGQFVDQDKTKVAATAEAENNEAGKMDEAGKTEEAVFVEIVFDPGFATLSDQSVDRLDAIIKRLKNEPDLTVLIRALSLKTDGSVTRNRLNSIKTYFKLRGIAQERVLIEKLQGDRDADEVKIFYSK
jgi:hypothetical protein